MFGRTVSIRSVLVSTVAFALLVANIRGEWFAVAAPLSITQWSFGWPFPFVVNTLGVISRSYTQLWLIPIDVFVAALYLFAASYVGKNPPLTNRTCRIELLLLLAVLFFEISFVYPIVPAIVNLTLLGGMILLAISGAQLLDGRRSRLFENDLM